MPQIECEKHGWVVSFSRQSHDDALASRTIKIFHPTKVETEGDCECGFSLPSDPGRRRRIFECLRMD